MDWLLIAGMAETGEEYLCQLLDHDARGHDPPPSPIVRVLAVLRWPRQRAITHPEIASEIPPLTPGLICHLPALRTLRPDEAAQALGDGFPSGRALDEAIQAAGSDGERDILLRHRAGEMASYPRVVTYRDGEWQRIRSNGRKGRTDNA